MSALRIPDPEPVSDLEEWLGPDPELGLVAAFTVARLDHLLARVELPVAADTDRRNRERVEDRARRLIRRIHELPIVDLDEAGETRLYPSVCPTCWRPLE